MKTIYMFIFIAIGTQISFAQMDMKVEKESAEAALSHYVQSGVMSTEDSTVMMQSIIVMKLETLNDEEAPDPFEMTYAEVRTYAYRHGYHFLSMLEPVVKERGKAFYSNGMEITKDDADILWDFIKQHQNIDYTKLQLEEVVDMAGG